MFEFNTPPIVEKVAFMVEKLPCDAFTCAEFTDELSVVKVAAWIAAEVWSVAKFNVLKAKLNSLLNIIEPVDKFSPFIVDAFSVEIFIVFAFNVPPIIPKSAFIVEKLPCNEFTDVLSADSVAA